MNIFLTGLTTSSLYGMEYRNLGNYIILEPLVKKLKETFPDSTLVTTLQLSNQFCERFDVTCLREKAFWTYGFLAARETLLDLIFCFFWFFLFHLGYDNRHIIRARPFLKYLDIADIIIDFSGDIYGDNAGYNKFLKSNANLLMAKLMGKKVAMLIGSPGPFKYAWKRAIARVILPHLDLITNRENLSTELLKSIGIKSDNIITTACPSYLFEKAIGIEDIIKKNELFHKSDKEVVGLIICGWNMPVAPHSRWPREDTEFTEFIELIRYLILKKNKRVCLMSHQNAVTPEGELVRGQDHKLLDKLHGLLKNEFNESLLFQIKGLYNAAESKAIIGHMNYLISGRIHGAVQGISQYVPTIIIDYGHEPKAHKLRGFAKMLELENFICNPTDAEQMKKTFLQLEENRDKVVEHLNNIVPQIQEKALYNFVLLQEMQDK